jgi:thioredoxin 1
MDRKKLVKIGVPVLIVLLIAGVWFIKNRRTDADEPAGIQAEATAGVPAAASDPNFTLHTEKIDLEVLSAYQLPMILDFGSDDCIPCKEMAPVLETLNSEMLGKAIIRFVDVWKHTNGADGFPIQVIPTQVLVNADGTPYVPSEAMASSGIRFTMYTLTDTTEHVFTVHQGGLTEEQMRLILKDMGAV